jgi:tripeptide aminopeptidase
MDAKSLFLKYVTFDTESDDSVKTSPSTPGQKVFARYLAGQLNETGLQDVSCDENGYVMATLPANGDDEPASKEKTPVIGFIAHLDTSPDLSGKNVKPQVVYYEGGDIVLNKELNITLSPAMFPDLTNYVNQDIIVTDGATLLGADDKAGIAAIVSAMDYLVKHPEIKHGKVRIGFTPDEEIGRGANLFDVGKFGCQWAYTVDGGAPGEIEYENFNAASARITFKGLNIHPGYAKGKMINAMQSAIDFHNRLPAGQRPSTTEGYEGFFHLVSFTGSVEEATISYIIRDHDKVLFEDRKRLVETIVDDIREKHNCEITLELKDQYYNMREMVEPHKEIIEIAVEAIKECGMQPLVKPIRGGTDGARLSFMGLPCPNLFAGGINFHGRYEFLPVKSLEKSRDTIIKIITLTYRKNIRIKN